ncbi:MAG TPA: response regulator [Thermomicrobiales bacterium]
MSRVVIIDDNPGFCDRLVSFVGEQAGCSVAGLASDTRSGLRLVRSARPDVVLIDVNLADESGLLFARHLAGLDFGVRIVLMGENETAEYEQAAAVAGASGYVSKTEIGRVLPALLRSPVDATNWQPPTTAGIRGGLIARASAAGTWGQAAVIASPAPRFAAWETVLSAATMLGGIALHEPAGVLAGTLGFAFLSYRQMTLPRLRGGQLGERVLRRTHGVR